MGYIFLFKSIYINFAYSVNNFNSNKKDNPLYDYPTVREGHRGMKFIDAVIESSDKKKWIKV